MSVALLDIDDVRAFVAAQVAKTPGVPMLHGDEADELIQEGLVILFELADRFQPHMPGYDKPGRFSGYAAWALPKRLQSAWRRMHPEHLTRKAPDGTRTLEYGLKPLSVDWQSDRDEEQHDGVDRRVLTSVTATCLLPGESRTDRLDAALTSLATHPHASAVVFHLSVGAKTDTEIALALGVKRMAVTRTRQDIAGALRLLEAA